VLVNPNWQAYAIDKLRHLALTEHGEIRSSACEMLWIFSVDQIGPDLRKTARAALDVAACQCIRKPDGNEACR
jgi:hypothetical protein